MILIGVDYQEDRQLFFDFNAPVSLGATKSLGNSQIQG
jgi:hypothetical protein